MTSAWHRKCLLLNSFKISNNKVECRGIGKFVKIKFTAMRLIMIKINANICYCLLLLDSFAILLCYCWPGDMPHYFLKFLLKPLKWKRNVFTCFTFYIHSKTTLNQHILRKESNANFIIARTLISNLPSESKQKSNWRK